MIEFPSSSVEPAESSEGLFLYTVLAATNVRTISPPLGRRRRRRRPSAAAASPVSYDDDKLQMGRCYQLGGALWYNIKILGHSIQNSIRCHLARQNF